MCIVFISFLRFVHLKMSLVIELFLLIKSPPSNRGPVCISELIHTMVGMVLACLVFRATVSIPGPRSPAGQLQSL